MCTPAELARLEMSDVLDRVGLRLFKYCLRPDEYEERAGFFNYGLRRGYFVARRGLLFLGPRCNGKAHCIRSGESEDPTGQLILDRRTDAVLVGDIDWEAMRSIDRREAAAWYDRCAREGRTLDWTGRTCATVSREAYILQEGEDYTPVTDAICDARGWLEGHIGQADWRSSWYRYVSALDQNTLVAVADCYSF
jgi:hypothetical protein